MVRDVQYITLSSSYRDLQEALITGQLKTLALVESKGETQNICLKVYICTKKSVVLHMLGILRQILDSHLPKVSFFPHVARYRRVIRLK